MNNKVEKIAAIVVTFNRKDLLPKCLEGILTQARPVDHIFLIDNASTDGTKEMIENLYKDNPLITYIRLSKNSGSAGGFHDGVKAAYDWGADWIWFLDDDVVPQPDCLHIMLNYKHISQCIHPNKIDIEKNEFMFESIFDPSIGRMTFLNNISFKHGKDFSFINIGCFEGMLIHRDIVSKIGFPDKRFFMYSDDTVYGFTASLHTNVIFIRDAFLHKEIAFKNTATPLFSYYAIRNQFLIKEYLKKYNLYNKYWFTLNLAIFVFTASTKQAIRSRSFKIPVYVLRGLIDGIKGAFYEIH